MPLETEINELTMAIKSLTAVLASTGAELKSGRTAEVAQKTTAETATKKAPAKKAPAKKAAAEVETTVEEATAGNVLTFEDVRTATRALAKVKGRDAVVDILSEFGVDKTTEVKEADFADYIKQANALAAG